jgi:membrane protein
LTFSAWNEHEAPRLAAALAFYTILSIAPLVIFAIDISALAFSHSTAQDEIVAQAQQIIGPEGATAFRMMIESAQKPASGLLASCVGVVTLLFGASGVFGELRSALNTMWDVRTNSAGGIAGLIKDRVASFGMVLAIGFLLIVSLVLSAGLAAAGKFFGGMLPLPEAFLSLINVMISFAGVSGSFALIFKYVPEARLSWKDAWIGAIATAFLFTIGKFLIGVYLGKAALGSAYGAAGSLIVVIVWVYYSSMIFFFGAEFTHVLAGGKTNGIETEPVKGDRSA